MFSYPKDMFADSLRGRDMKCVSLDKQLNLGAWFYSQIFHVQLNNN